MQPRYALRFDNGERQGETVQITGPGITIGRKPGNSVQLLDASVSGRHAEFLVEPGGVLLRDLGSTNGTRVGGERVSEQRLAHGDEVLLGNVKLVLLDSEVGAAADSSPRGSSSAPPTGDAVRTVSAEKIKRAGKRSLVGAALVVVALVAAGASAWWWLGQAGAGGSGTVAQPVEVVEGNLLAKGYSFEGEGAAWEDDEAAPVAFALESGARRSGDNGLGALVAKDEWALARSPVVRPGRGLRLDGWTRAQGALEAYLGIELRSTSGASATTVVWRAVASGEDFARLSSQVAVPPCFDEARAVVLARSTSADGGSLDVDDIALVPAADTGAVETLEEFQLWRLGDPASAALLFKIDRTLLSDIHAKNRGGRAGDRAALTSTRSERGFELACGAGEVLSLRVDETLLKGGSATTGAGGYRAQVGEFTREATASLILGAGKDLVCLAFAAPVTLRARPEGSGLRVEVELGANKGAFIQLAFRAERDDAQVVARAARESEKAGRLGESAASWGRLRDEFPFDPALLAEAETSRTRLAERGLAEVRELRREVERARFFRLVDIYRECRSGAQAVAERYLGSEVQGDAEALLAEIGDDLAVLETDLERVERGRLEAIARSLEAAQSTKLAARVRDYLARGSAPATNGAR